MSLLRHFSVSVRSTVFFKWRMMHVGLLVHQKKDCSILNSSCHHVSCVSISLCDKPSAGEVLLVHDQQRKAAVDSLRPLSLVTDNSLCHWERQINIHTSAPMVTSKNRASLPPGTKTTNSISVLTHTVAPRRAGLCGATVSLVPASSSNESWYHTG